VDDIAFKHKVGEVASYFDGEKLHKCVVISTKVEATSRSYYNQYLVEFKNEYATWVDEGRVHSYIDTTDIFANVENMSIIDIFQKVVNKITEQYYSEDECPPEFTVSLYEKDNGKECTEHELILTIEHGEEKRSRKLFPRLDCKYGYENIKDEMKWLYNSTM